MLSCVVSLVFSRPAQAGNETLTLETYYPAPYGIYNEFTTTGQTLLATESGSVGIGTAGAPEELLHLKSAQSDKTIIRLDDSGGIHQMIIRAGQSGIVNPAIGMQSSESFELISNNKAVMVIGNNGRVGIGTQTPGAKLEISSPSTETPVQVGQIIKAPVGQNAYIDFKNGDVTNGNIWSSPASSQPAFLGINNQGTNTILNPAGGNVGIGTFGLLGPQAPLHIHSEAGDNVVYRVTSKGKDSSFPGTRAGYHLSGTLSTGPGYAIYHDNGDKSLHINYDVLLGAANKWLMTFTTRNDTDNFGIVGIGTGQGYGGPWPYDLQYILDVNGGIRCVSIQETSDLRYKKNIVTLPGPLEKLSRLRGVEFDWKQEEYKENNFPAGRQIGIIAQELEKEFPELVSTDKSGYKSIAYDKLTAVLLEAVKELDAKYKAGIAESETEHKKEVKKLESEISDLSNELKKK